MWRKKREAGLIAGDKDGNWANSTKSWKKMQKKALWVLARCMLEMHDMQREGNIHGVVACWNGGKECSQKENQGIQLRCISLGLHGGNSSTFLSALNTHYCSSYNLQSTIMHFGVELILHFKQIGMFIVRDSTGGRINQRMAALCLQFGNKCEATRNII